jgi:hypothetical protein
MSHQEKPSPKKKTGASSLQKGITSSAQICPSPTTKKANRNILFKNVFDNPFQIKWYQCFLSSSQRTLLYEIDTCFAIIGQQ